MGKYEIKFNKQDGWSYGKEKIPVESDYVELSDDEVQILINLMKEKETYDVSELNIEELHPEIYNKLVDTWDSVAWDVALAEAARNPQLCNFRDFSFSTYINYLSERFLISRVMSI